MSNNKHMEQSSKTIKKVSFVLSFCLSGEKFFERSLSKKTFILMHFLKLNQYTGFELSVLQSQNAIYFSFIAMPKKSHFTIY